VPTCPTTLAGVHGVGSETAASQGVWAPERRRLTTGLVLAVTVVAFEALAVATVLPIVSRSLGDLRLYGWVFSAFLLASLLGITVTGTLADRGPLQRLMLAGLGLFAAGLLVGGTAPDMAVLVGGRALQGLGAGVVPAVGYVAISRGYPDGCRPRMFAVLSTAWVVPGLVGPAAAAVVATTVGWRWVFLGLLPLVGIAGLLAVLALRHVPPPDHVRHNQVPYLPVMGVIAGAAVALGSATDGDIVVVLAGLACGISLLAVSLRSLTPPGTLRAARGLPATVLTRGLATFTFFAGEAYVPYALTTVRHSPPTLAALALVASTLTWTGGSWTQARFIGRIGPRRLVRIGELVALLGLAMMGLVLAPAVPAALGVLAWGVAGGGMGLAYAPLSVTTLDWAAPGEVGKAASGLQLCDVLGQALGTGGAGALVAVTAAGPGHRVGVALAFALGGAAGVTAVLLGHRIPERLRGVASTSSTPVRPEGAAGPGSPCPSIDPTPELGPS
jgi:MFS family permease